MSVIDSKIVEMKFNNSEFERGAQTSMSTLDKLKRSLKLDGVSKGLDNVGAASKRISFSGLTAGISEVSTKFSAMGIAGVTALATIANKATNVGINLVKSLTIKPMKAGLQEYETNLNAIQTILANTSTKGGNLKTVNAALSELNEYSDKTIYNFAQMARNVGTFTAAGVGLDTSVAAIKGIANLAAVSGSNAEQASGAMYQISQALSTGTVKLQDWNSIVNSGMGGEVFQNSLKETARVQGVSVDALIKKNGSFRESLQEGWLTDEILTSTLAKFTGDMTAAQLSAEGYNAQQVKEILALGKVSTDAATKVKTFSQLMGTLAEAAGSGWSRSWQLILGDFDEAKILFTNVNNVLGGMIGASSEARNKILGDWNKDGGRTALINGIANAFKALMAIAKPIGDALKAIFPPSTGKQLADMSRTFEKFTKTLIISKETGLLLTRIFKGVFAVFSIGWELVKIGVNLFKDLFGQLDLGGGSFLEVAAKVADFVVRLRNVIKYGRDVSDFFEKMFPAITPVIALIETFADTLKNAFGNIKSLLTVPLSILKEFGSYLVSIFGGFDTTGAQKSITDVTSKFNPLTKIGELLAKAWNKAFEMIKKMPSGLGKLGEVFGKVGETLMSVFSNLDYGQILSTINTGLLAGLVLILKNFLGGFKGGGGGAKAAGGGFIENITAPFTKLTATLDTMQNTLRAATLLQIAAAIGIMALAVIGLSKIDAEGLDRAMAAMALMFLQLGIALSAFQKIAAKTSPASLLAMGAALVLMAIAIRILTSAVAKLAELEWEELAKGLGGVIVLIAALVLAVKGMSGAGGMVASGAGLILMAIGLKILVSVIRDLSKLSWGEIAKGLTALGGALLVMVVAMNAMQHAVLGAAAMILMASALRILVPVLKSLSGMSWKEIAKGLGTLAAVLLILVVSMNAMQHAVLGAAALVIIASALRILVPVLKSLSGMTWKEIAKGLTALGAALLILVLAMNGMQHAILGAAALVIIASALRVLVPVLKSLSSMTWEEIAKGLITLGAALLIMVVAMNAMQHAILGAAALVIMASALRILIPVLMTLGTMAWGDIAKGLLALAGVFVIMGLAGVILGPLVPVLMGLGLALTLMGAGLALAGVGVLAFSIGLTALAVSGGAAGAAIVSIIKGLINLLPVVVKAVAAALLAAAEGIVAAAPAVFKAITVVIMELMKAIVTLTPPIVKTLVNLMTMLLGEIVKAAPKWITAVLKLLLGILNSIGQQAPAIIKSVINLMLALLTEVVKAAPKIVVAVVNLMVAFLSALTTKIPTIVATVVELMVAFLGALTKKVPIIVKTVVNLMVAFLKGVTDSLPKLITAAVDLMIGFLKGIEDNIPKVLTAGVNIILKFLKGISDNTVKVVDAGIKMIIDFINGIANSIRQNTDAMNKAGMNLADAIVDGMTSGLRNGAGRIKDMAKNVAKGALDGAKGLLGVDSPSKEFIKIGEAVNEGFIEGLVGGEEDVTKAYTVMDDLLKNAMDSAIQNVERLTAKLVDLDAAKKTDIQNIKDTQIALAAAHAQNKAEAEKDANDIENLKTKLTALRAVKNNDRQITKQINADLALERARNKAETEKDANVIENLKARLSELNGEKKKDIQAIKETSDALVAARALQKTHAADQIADIDKIKARFGKLDETKKKDIQRIKETSDALAAARERQKTHRIDQVADIDAIKLKLAEQTAEQNNNIIALKDTTLALAEAQIEVKNASAAHAQFTVNMIEERNALSQLGRDYDVLKTKLEEADKVLIDAKKSRDDYNANLAATLSALPTLKTESTMSSYITELEKKVIDTDTFTAAVLKLRTLGLNDEGYKEILAKGVEAIPFVNSLLDGGQAAVTHINNLNERLKVQANVLGTDSAAYMYEAGVQTAAGLVKALEDKKSAVLAAMRKIAEGMVKEIKDKLKIKSPSKAFAEVAGFSIEGLVNGLKSGTQMVKNAAGDIGTDALESMRKSLSGMDGITQDMDLIPVIRPVLDLSDVKSGAGQIGSMLSGNQISVGTAYSTAKNASADYRTNQIAGSAAVQGESPITTTFTQNNYSPTALSAADIYRQTKNQLSVVKGALTG